MTGLKSSIADEEFSQKLNSDLEFINAKKKVWATLSLKEKILILKEVRSQFPKYVDALGLEGSKIRGLDNSPPDIAYESVMSCLIPLSYINKLIYSLECIANTGSPPPLERRQLPNGQTAVKIWPATLCDKLHLLLPSATAELYLQPKNDDLSGEVETAGGIYMKNYPDLSSEGSVCAILAPGNHGFLGLKDALVELYEHNRVVALKPHPQMRPWQAVADCVLDPLRRRGFYISLSYCEDVRQTTALLHHPLVQHVQMTGGTATHDAIVWGSSAEVDNGSTVNSNDCGGEGQASKGERESEQTRRKRANDPLLKKPITSELGCVTPWIVVGGATWSAAELETQAWNVAMAAFFNCSCNCNAAKVIVVQGDWPQANAFICAIRRCLWDFPSPPPYYPGITGRFQAFRDRYPDAEVIEPAPQTSTKDFGPALPFLLNVMDRIPANPDLEYAFTVEPFAPVLTVVKLDPKSDPFAARCKSRLGSKADNGHICSSEAEAASEKDSTESKDSQSETVPAFLEAAVRLVNDHVWGSLSCSVLVHPSLEAQPTAATAVEKAILDLKYGLVAVNAWSGMAIALGVCTWGAFVGNQTLRDIGSGTGPAGNPYLVPRIQKTVYRVPLSGMAHRGPPHKQPLPQALVKAAVGYAAEGGIGAVTAFFSQKKQ
uniref:Aldehyde dehydrogenase domain-containing protein n=1 Tax=Polytomella parva TaxID=51329 RepID=A0A7S0VM25_9CHLO